MTNSLLSTKRLRVPAGYDADTAMVNGNGNHEHSDEAEAKQDGADETEGGEESNDQEVIVIQDTGFTVKIQAPGTEPFDLQVRIGASLRFGPRPRDGWSVASSRHAISFQVSPQEMVQEIHQVLMDREDTCHRTCFSLQLDGNVLDNFAELKSIEGLQEGSLLKVVEGEALRTLNVT